ncbi:hypothetical protein GR11A_00050 [Vibrio phage vB_VcorM_GR11A]|nr:hypothetical protein GR11A_00050 [Vibrio phage vB_VcorM_GR11A]
MTHFAHMHGTECPDIPELYSPAIYEMIGYLNKFNCGATISNIVHMIDEGPLNGFAISPSPFSDSDQRLDLEWEIPHLHNFCHAYIPYTQEQISEGAPQLIELVKSFGAKFLSIETAIFKDMDTSDKRFLWLNSPVADLNFDTFESYLASLTKKRRYKVKQALNQPSASHVEVFEHCDHLGNWTSSSGKTITADTIERRTVEILRSLYPDYTVYECALIQSLWFWSFAKTTTDKTRLCVVYSESGDVVSLGGFMNRTLVDGVTTSMFQSNVGEKEAHNVGALMLSSMVKHYIENPCGVTVLDPTCRTSIQEGLSFEIYKRVITNKNNVNTQICFCVENPGYLTPPIYSEDKGWELSEDLVIIGTEV